MDVYRIIVSPEAEKQLDGIIEFVRMDSGQRAEALAEKIEEAFQSLDIFPRKHSVRERRRDPEKTTYGVVVFSYIIYYRVDDAKMIVKITSIRHGARRQPRRFP